MDQVKETTNILLIRRSASEENSEPWNRLKKSLKAFAELKEMEQNESLDFSKIAEVSADFDKVFMDLSLVDFSSFSKGLEIQNLTLVRNDSFSWQNPEARKLMLPVLAEHSCLLLEDMALPDLIRTLHLFIYPKRLAGVTPLLEKGGLVLAEKIQNTDNVGSILDKLVSHLKQIEELNLKERFHDLRQVLSAVLIKGLSCARNMDPNYGTLDFQVGANKNKILVNLRFPMTKNEIKAIPMFCLDGTDLFFHQAWLCSDLLQVVHHTQYNEIELMFVINRETRTAQSRFRSFLFKSSDRSLKSENLFSASKNYEFKIISDIRSNQKLAIQDNEKQDINEIDFGSLPETVTEKIALLSEENAYFKDRSEKNEFILKESLKKLQDATKLANERGSHLARLAQLSERKQEAANKIIQDLKRQIDLPKKEQKEDEKTNENQNKNAIQEAISKLENSLKSSEKEKYQIQEKNNQDQKKIAQLEQKYTNLYKELANKEKEIGELKSIIAKNKREESQSASSSKQNGKGAEGVEVLATKIKELETRENVLKQEIRKLNFKVENNEKNVKAIQLEASDKAKMMEQKLQSAKTKEVELLKKIEELSAALKKTSKAA